MTNRNLVGANRVSSEIDFAQEAARLLQEWSPLVGKVPQWLATDDRRRAARELVDWYTGVSRADDFDDPPPADGLDALIDELAEATAPVEIHLELARARWAVRVAEELVRWRSCLRRAGDGSRATAEATDRLELALERARLQIAGT